MDKDVINLAEKILYTAGVVTSFWKGIDALFAYLHKRQRGFISDIVKEELRIEILPLKQDIEELKEQREKDNRFQNDMLQKILSEVKR